MAFPVESIGNEKAIYTVDTTQKFPLGMRMVLGDGRVFRYASFTTGGVRAGWGAFATAALPMAYEALHANAAIGDTTITVEQASIAKDAWKDGYIVMGHGSQDTVQNRRIVGNTASASSTNHVTVTLDGPMTIALTTSYGFEIMPNPYKALSVTSNEFSGVMGVPACTALTGQFGWVQTWGPCWVVPGGSGTPGSTAGERAVYFVGDGSINAANGMVSEAHEAHDRQYAGFIIQRDSSGSGGPPFIMLQLCP